MVSPGRFSFRIGSRKEKVIKPDQLQPVTGTLPKEKLESVKVKEVEESYLLPEIPLTPLSGWSLA